ncbi:MAG: hypothetical protein NTW87_22045 [Planctomycetota bacterium]|nr:hypothetical protein [Planctomycetota bacterium]
MTTAQLRNEARRRLDSLPADKVKVAAEFLAFLDDRASDEATAELLAIPGLLEDLAQAKRDQTAGKGVEWRKVRSDVYGHTGKDSR